MAVARSTSRRGSSPREEGADRAQAVKSAARVLDILELLRDEGRSLTLTEMSSRLGIPMSSLHSLVNTLLSRNYLEKREPGLSYQLGPALIALARHKQEAIDLVEEADAELAELSQASGESTSLGVLDGRDVIIVHRRVSNQTVRVVNPVGTRLPAHATSLGKCLLSGLSERDLARLYPTDGISRVTANAVTSLAELRHVLGETQAAGLAYDRQESSLGLFAVGSPIHDSRGHIVAAVSIAAPAVRATEDNIRHWEKLVLAGAARISARLGYRKD